MVRVMRGCFVIGPGLCLLVATAGCYPRDIAAPPVTPPRTVEVIEVRAQPVADAVTLIGRIEPWREATLYFEVSGVVAEVFVEEGAAVNVGDPIASLDLEDFRLAVSLAQANLDAATAQLDLLLAGTRREDIEAAKADYARTQAHEAFWTAEAHRIEELSKTGAASDSELRKAQRDHLAAIEDTRSTKAALDRAIAGPRTEEIAAAQAESRARQQALAQANRQLEKATVTAPFRGIVEKRFVDPGAYVNVFPTGGVPIVHLVDLEKVDAVISVPEASLDRLVGQTEIEIRSATDAGISALGRVEAIGNVADRAAGTYELRARLANANRRFRGGMVVTATSRSSTQRNVVRIPLTALRRPYGQSPTVLLVSPEGNRVISRTVELGPVRDDDVEIVHGLEVGEWLIVGGQDLVVPGDVVKQRKVEATTSSGTVTP